MSANFHSPLEEKIPKSLFHNNLHQQKDKIMPNDAKNDPQNDPQNILAEITQIAFTQATSQESKQIIGEGSFNRVYQKDLEISVETVNNHRKTQTSPLAVVCAFPKTEPDTKAKALAEQKAAHALLAEKNVRSPFLDTSLAQVNGARIAMRAKSDLWSCIVDQKKKAFNNNEKFSPVEVKEIIGQLVLALEALHKNGIVHRDLKPDNILFFEDISVSPRKIKIKITDFDSIHRAQISEEKQKIPPGSLVDRNGKPKPTEEIFSVGTPHYLDAETKSLLFQPDTPKKLEQYRDLNFFQADIFALGKTIDQIATGTNLAQLKTDFESLLAENPAQRPTIAEIKENTYFGGTPENRQAFFDDLHENHQEEMHSGDFLIGPYSNPEEVFNLLPAHIKEAYSAFQHLTDQYHWLEQKAIWLKPEVFNKPWPAHIKEAYNFFKDIINQYGLELKAEYLQTKNFNNLTSYVKKEYKTLQDFIVTFRRYPMEEKHLEPMEDQNQKSFIKNLFLFLKNFELLIQQCTENDPYYSAQKKMLDWVNNQIHEKEQQDSAIRLKVTKEIEENILRIKTNEEKWIAVRDANEEKSRQERQKKNEDEKQSILENIRQAITVPPQSDPNKYLTDLNTAINLFYHYLILPGTPEDTQNKSLLRPYIAQVESDLTKMNPKYLPEVTELTYRILLSQISPEDTDNTQHAINLATRMRELKKWRYLGNFALIILCATLLASAVIVLLASVAHGGCGASGHYLASFLNFLSAKHWSITAAKITDVTPYVTAAVVTGSSLFGLFATHNLKENAASIINKKANSATAELFLNQPRSKPHDSKISDSEASDAKLSEPGDHKSH